MLALQDQTRCRPSRVAPPVDHVRARPGKRLRCSSAPRPIAGPLPRCYNWRSALARPLRRPDDVQSLLDPHQPGRDQLAVRVVNRYVGNLAPMPGVFPDYKAPIVRTGADGRELATARWGMPSSGQALLQAHKNRAEKLQAKGKAVGFKELLRMEPDGGTNNIRNVKSKHWTRWLGVEHRCVVPFNSFSEFNKAEGDDIWFPSTTIDFQRWTRVMHKSSSLSLRTRAESVHHSQGRASFWPVSDLSTVAGDVRSRSSIRSNQPRCRKGAFAQSRPSPSLFGE